MLQTGGQRQVVDPRRRILVQDLADGIKLDEISAQRPSQEGLPSKPSSTETVHRITPIASAIHAMACASRRPGMGPRQRRHCDL